MNFLWSYTAWLNFFIFNYTTFITPKILFKNYRSIFRLGPFIELEFWLINFIYILFWFIDRHPLAFLQISFWLIFKYRLFFKWLSLIYSSQWQLCWLRVIFFTNFQIWYFFNFYLIFLNCFFYIFLLTLLCRNNEFLRRRPRSRQLVIRIWSLGIYTTKWFLRILYLMW